MKPDKADELADRTLHGARLTLREDGAGMECVAVATDTGTLIGSATLGLPPGKAGATINFRVAPEAQGRGFATETTRLLAGWGFAHGIHRIEIGLDVTDLASARVALRAGFGFESVRRDGLRVGEARRDLAVFVRTADDPGDPIEPFFAALPNDQLSDGVLALRPPLLADLAGFVEQETDVLTLEVGFTGQTPSVHVMERLLARARLDWLVGPIAPFTMIDVASGTFAGSLRLREVGPPNVGGLGYAVHPAFRGRGYTARALRLLLPWAFEQAGFARLELGAKRDNAASQRAAATAGFEPDGTMAARLRNADGSFSDEVRYAVVNPRYG